VTASIGIVAAVAATTWGPRGDPDDSAARGVSAVQGSFFLLSPFSFPSHLAHGAAHVAWQIVRAGACRARPPLRAHLLLVPFLALQVLMAWIDVQYFAEHPWPLALLVAWCGYAGWDALRGSWDPPAQS